MFHRAVYWGQFCFIIHVNALSKVVQSKLWMLADDTKIYRTIFSKEDFILLQNDFFNFDFDYDTE